MHYRLGLVLAALLLLVAILAYLAVGPEFSAVPPAASPSRSDLAALDSHAAPVSTLSGSGSISAPASEAKPLDVRSASTPQVAERRERNRMVARETTEPSLPAPPAAAPANSPSPSVAGSPESESEAARDLDKVTLMLRDYRTRMGENPFGTNAEIMKAVMGENPVRAVLGPPEGQHLNEKGELVDRWGTPYFFHQISASNMEIHSAGPDRIRGTGDDIIQH